MDPKEKEPVKCRAEGRNPVSSVKSGTGQKNGFLDSQSTWPRAQVLVERIGEWISVPIQRGGSGKPEPHQSSSIGSSFCLGITKQQKSGAITGSKL